MQKISALPAQAVPQTTNPASQVNPLPANAIELKDIHVPEQISNYPIAYGWWLLAALLILVTIISIVKIRKATKRNQVKKQALQQLKNNPKMAITDTIALLKWAAMHYFSRAELAKLFGDSLQKFLTLQLPINHQKNFIDLSGQAFLNQYQAQPKANKDANGDENDHNQADDSLYQAATLWLTHALPPKASKVTNKSASTSENNSQGVNA
mgnify:CR=1 FL=1